jgi:hypothetical protein
MMQAASNCSSGLPIGLSSVLLHGSTGSSQVSVCLFSGSTYILVLGRRHEGLSNVAKGYLEYLVHVMGYTYIMTDKRPDILPVAVKIFEE